MSLRQACAAQREHVTWPECGPAALASFRSFPNIAGSTDGKMFLPAGRTRHGLWMVFQPVPDFSRVLCYPVLFRPAFPPLVEPAT